MDEGQGTTDNRQQTTDNNLEVGEQDQIGVNTSQPQGHIHLSEVEGPSPSFAKATEGKQEGIGSVPKLEIPKLNAGIKPAMGGLKKSGMKGPGGMLFAIGMIAVGLAVGALFLSRFLPKPAETPVTPSPTPVATGSATPTGEAMGSGEVALQVLSLEEIGYDKDGDVVPDRIEELLGYDPGKNDCVRQLGCGDFPTVPRAKLEINLIFLLDASGSMSEKLEGVTKWESGKKALLDLLDSGLPKFANVALVVYGHKGSANVADREASCKAVEVIEPLLGVDVKRTEAVVNALEPKGWTSIAGALEKSGDLLKGKEFAQNFVILLSDGNETCGGDPAAMAKKLHQEGAEVVTNVVGLAVNDIEKQQLELIAQSGGGRYFGAATREELSRALILSAEAVRLWDQVNQCILDNLSGYGQCVNVQYLRSLNYIGRLRLYLGEQAGGVTGAGFIERAYEDLSARVWEKFNQLREENWNQYDEDLKKLYPH